MKRWIVVAAVLALFLGAMVASAVAQHVLLNSSKSANAPSAATLGLVPGDECQKIIKKLREASFRQASTSKGSVWSSSGGLVDAMSYTFVGPSKAVVLIDCAVLSS